MMLTSWAFSHEENEIRKDTPAKAKKTLVSSTENEIIIDVKIDGYYATAVNTPHGEQYVISGDDMAAMLVKGAPNLPMLPIPVIIGDKAEMQLSVINTEYYDVNNIEVAPSKGNINRQINPDDVEYVYGEMYQQDAFYPAHQATLEKPYIIRDFRGQNIMVYPYAYNPVTKTLRVYTQMTIVAKKISDNGLNPKTSRRNNVADSEIVASYERRFINYSNNRYSFLDDNGEMLIVCVDEYLDELQDLVDWKNISGRPTSIVPVSTTGTLDDLKSYLQSYYNSHPNLTHILLVGEHDNLPAYPTTVIGGFTSARTDNYYAQLDGDDLYLEVFIGRLSVANKIDAENQVKKIIYYERDIDENATWLNKGIGIGSVEGNGHYGEKDYQHIDFIRDTLMNYTYQEISQRYEGVYSATTSDITADFNNGVGIANYCNHGTKDSWVIADFNTTCVNSLTNDYKLPFIWSSACYNGQFDYNECFAEAWQRAVNPTNNAPTGAIGGMFSWISQPWIPPMYGQDEMVNILTEWRDGYKHTLAGASLNGNMYILDMSPDDEGDTYKTWILFGDPSLMLRTSAPQRMNVECDNTLYLGMTEMFVNANAEYGIATLSMNGEVIASANIENNTAKLNFPALDTPGIAKLVVIGYNKVTEIMDINVSPAEGAYLVCTDYELNQEDGQLDYAETIDLSLMVKNIGNEKVENINVKLSSDSEYITILDNEATINALPAKMTANINKGFKIAVSPNVPDQTIISFTVECTTDSETWNSDVHITANAPLFVIDNVSVVSENPVLYPGDKATLRLDIINDGNSMATNVMTEIFSSSDDIIFDNTSIKEEQVEARKSFVVTSEFTLSDATENGYSYEIAYSVSSGNYITDSTLFINIGSMFEDFESASFGSYNWESDGSAPWTISEGAYEGSYCAKSGKITDNQYSSMYLVMDIPSSGELSFYRKVSCEWKFDSLLFMVDGKAIDGWHDFVDWGQVSYTLPPGTHTLEWRYDKDPADSGKDDCGYIDNISLPPFNIVTSLSAVENLTATTDETTVTLSWDANANAEEYIIRRDGAEITTQSETTFTETLDNGVYTYSIVARNGKNYSLPAFVVAIINTVSLNEMSMPNVSIYPNPTTGILNVDIDNDFDAVVYNYQGQVMMKMNGNNRQLNLSNLTAGIYFVEIRTNNHAFVKKVILK